jgi:flagellar biosynthesis protein FlhB
MQQNFTMNGLQTLLYFPFKDTDSRNKLLIASALGFASFIIPIIPWLFILGYAGAIMKQIIVDKQEPFMPDWKNWNEYISLGGKLFGVSLVYAIPTFIPVLLGYLGMMLPAIIGILSGNSHSFLNSDRFSGIVMLSSFGGMILFGIGMFFSLILWVFLPPALAHVVAKDSFAAGFQFRDWWKIFKANIGGFFLSLVISGGLYMALIIAMQIIYMTLILCILLPFLLAFISAYLTIIIFTLVAQAYREGVMKLEESII